MGSFDPWLPLRYGPTPLQEIGEREGREGQVVIPWLPPCKFALGWL